MKFALGCKLGYKIEGTASFVLNLQPAELPQQKLVRESLVVTPDVPRETYVMPESGNRYVRFTAPAGELLITYDAEVELEAKLEDPNGIAEVPRPQLPFATLPHLYPSRFCQSDRLARAVQSDFGHLPPGHARVTAICNWIYEHIEYRRGSSDEHTSAMDTLIDRAGVCRDFAHLGIALCRALGIPARYVSCYAWRLDPPDFHAVFEAYLGGRWYLFDATRQAALDGLVRIGLGRDASEVAFTSIDGKYEPTVMQVHIAPATPLTAPYAPTVQAVTTTTT